MKLQAIFIILLIFSELSGQEVSGIYTKISDECGNQIITEIKNKGTELYKIVPKQNIRIAVLPLRNERNEVTKISMNLTPKLTVKLQENKQANLSAFNDMQFFYADKQAPVNSSDFVLIANYRLDNENFHIENIVLKTPQNDKQVAISNVSAKVENITALNAENYAFIAENIEQLSRAIVAQYAQNIGLTQVTLNNFLNDENDMPSRFSELLADCLESDFVAIANISVQRNRSRGLNSNVRYVITGKYYVLGDKIKVISMLKDPQTNNTVATATAFISKKYLENNNIAYFPENNQQFEQRKQILKNTEVKDEFDIDVWTNKGNNKPIFKEGETMQIFVETSEVCYIRVIDVFADGTQILLVKNEKIDGGKVGRPYQLPYNFQCSEPFGAETIIVMAQTTPFPELQTVDYFGYNKIINTLEQTRAFGVKGLKAEKYINILTIKK